MRKTMLSLVILFTSSALSAGCGSEPRLDATSDASLDASMKNMADRLEPEKKDELARSMTILSLPLLMKSAFDPKAEKPTKASIFKPFHGMTADEIIAKAKSSSPAFAKAKATEKGN